ncbi:hypothetical protein [Leptodesmis sp.]|uniref:hypothetical protein n=1 Tax=Leptodesmis sp. TaxID=3100501 RepID=UPI0040535941
MKAGKRLPAICPKKVNKGQNPAIVTAVDCMEMDEVAPQFLVQEEESQGTIPNPPGTGGSGSKCDRSDPVLCSRSHWKATPRLLWLD